MVILGFPRTATTVIYVVLRDILKEHLAVLEPFNPECVTSCAISGLVEHNVLGKVSDDFNKLPNDLRYLIAINGYWYYDWLLRTKPYAPWCGWYWREIFERLHEMSAPILVKDVCIWTELDELSDKYKDTLFVLTIRGKDAVLKAFQRWYVPYTTTYKLARAVSKLRRALSNTDNVKAGIIYMASSIKVSPALRVIRVYGKKFNIREPIIKTWTVVKNVIEKIYAKYIETISKVSERNNVLKIQFADQLSKDELTNIAYRVKIWLRK